MRVGDELLLANRRGDLVPLDHVARRKGHRYLALAGDHRAFCAVWGTAGKGQAAADELSQALYPQTAA